MGLRLDLVPMTQNIEGSKPSPLKSAPAKEPTWEESTPPALEPTKPSNNPRVASRFQDIKGGLEWRTLQAQASMIQPTQAQESDPAAPSIIPIVT